MPAGSLHPSLLNANKTINIERMSVTENICDRAVRVERPAWSGTDPLHIHPSGQKLPRPLCPLQLVQFGVPEHSVVAVGPAHVFSQQQPFFLWIERHTPHHTTTIDIIKPGTELSHGNVCGARMCGSSEFVHVDNILSIDVNEFTVAHTYAKAVCLSRQGMQSR